MKTTPATPNLRGSLQRKMFNFAVKYHGWHSLAHNSIRTARNLALRGLIELIEYPKVNGKKPYPQFRFNPQNED